MNYSVIYVINDHVDMLMYKVMLSHCMIFFSFPDFADIVPTTS